MKKILLTLFSLLTALTSFAAGEEEPIITFKTNIYDIYGAANSFTIRLGSTRKEYFDIDCGAGKNEAMVDVATFDSSAGSIKATSVSCSVGPEGIVRIYGDASLIDYFDGEGVYMDWIELGDCTNLNVLDLQHNMLSRLDLSKYTNLSAIYLTGNPFTPETPLVIGENHPNLAILEVDIIDYMTPDFDITFYPNLVSFDAFANRSLTHLDPSKCPNLCRISVDSCPIRSLDVSHNPNLLILNVEDSGITELDLSNNPKLAQLYIRHGSDVLNSDCKFTSIDISKNPELTVFTALGNRLTSIDLSNNPLLYDLNLAENLLTDIDVSRQTGMVNFNISKNYLTYATLPAPNPEWNDYVYDQRPMKVERSYAEGMKIDLSDKVIRPNSATAAELYAYDFAANKSRKLDESYYRYDKGVVTLLKACPDSLYLSFANSDFIGMALETTHFMVKTKEMYGKPSEALHFSTLIGAGSEIRMSVGVAGASADAPKTVYIDAGDGELQEFTVACACLPEVPNVVCTKRHSAPVVIYMPEGETLFAFGLDGFYLTDIDLTAATELRWLDLRGAELYNIDLSYNRDLRSLTLTGNHFGDKLSLEGVNGISAKNMLSDLNLSGNEITSVVLNDTRSIRNLDLSHNKLADFPYKEFEYTERFDLSYNSLTEVNAAYLGNADFIDVSHNLLSAINLPETAKGELVINYNCFTFANIPLAPKGTKAYRYAPQSVIGMPDKAPGVNLSVQNRVIDGTGTTFVWKIASGDVLVEGTDYSIYDGGTTFLEPMIGKMVYCEMTNPAFPDLYGEYALRTSVMEAAEPPANLIASFVTPVGGQEAKLSLASDTDRTALYVDWSGKGYAMEQYVLGTTYRIFGGKTIEGAEAKVYTYTPEEHVTVFSVDGVKMSSFDGTKLADAKLLGLYSAGLQEVSLPESDRLEELSLTGNALTALPDLSRYKNLKVLDLAANTLTTADLGTIPSLECAYLGSNKLTEVRFNGNNRLWLFDASANRLSDIDFTEAASIDQLDLSSNLFSHIDVSPLTNLKAMQLSDNRFDFTTLPQPQESYGFYSYFNQAPLSAECADGRVDLGSQAFIGTEPTEYRWFVGAPQVDEDGNLIGEELVADDEYTVKEGVTTFNIDLDGVMCVMTNAVFPRLYLYTELMNVTSGVEGSTVDEADADYYTLQGIRVCEPLPGQIYIVRRGDSATKEVR